MISIDNTFKKSKKIPNINILSYNINGLGNKLLYSEFFNYINSFDIVILLETHVEENKLNNFKKYFSNFDLFWKPAKRQSNFGRGIGGCMYAVKNSLIQSGLKHSFNEISEVITINIQIKQEIFTIIPLYLRSANWEKEFGDVRRLFVEKNIVNPLIIGDLNIRIGETQQIYEGICYTTFKCGQSVRRSKDKTVDNKGKHFLEFCDDYGITVLNGITEGDEMGNFTYISNVGQSVNDVCAISNDLLKHVDGFFVENYIWSDHLPIHLVLQIDMDEQEVQTCGLLPKLRWNENKKENYQRKVQHNLEVLRQQNPAIKLNDLTELIVISSGNFGNNLKTKSVNFKDKWFDLSCLEARDESFRLLRAYRRSSDEIEKKAYLFANRKYKNICEERKSLYYKSLELKICKINNSKEWWNLAREIRGDIVNPCPNITAAVFRTYFDHLLNPPQLCDDIFYVAELKEDPDLDAEISVAEVQKMLLKTKSNKAPGIDRVPYEFFINAPVSFLEELTKAYNTILETGITDDKFITSVIYPIYKKGNNSDPNNYRGISFMNCVAKIMMGILNERLSSWTDKHNILLEYQAGFRKNYSTVDNIYSLSAIVHLKFYEKKKVYAFFVDFKAAFDKISRRLLIYKLYEMGVSTKFVNVIEAIYRTTKSVVWTGKELSEEFETRSGVKQGCLLSPLLFALYINDLHDALCGGLHIDGVNIRLLLYADDIVIMADNVRTLQNMIINLERYCIKWNLEVNLSKSEIMVFRNGGKISNQEKWRFNGNEIKIASNFCYLGMTLTPKMVFKKHIEIKNIAAKNSINATWSSFLSKHNISIRAKWQLFQAVCRSIQTYGAQVWGSSLFEEVNKLQRYFVKKILNLPSFTPTYALMLETNMQDAHLYTLDLHLRYIGRTLFEYEASRLPHQLSIKLIEKNLSWVTNLIRISDQFNIIWDFGTSSYAEWNLKKNQLLENLRLSTKLENIQSALGTDRFYKYLDHTKGLKYMVDEHNQSTIMWIFKARCDMIELNGTRFTSNSIRLCSLCNLNETEDIQHFLGRCPILKHLRLQYLGYAILPNELIVATLNGAFRNWDNLVKYITNAIKYRKFLINEFNY